MSTRKCKGQTTTRRCPFHHFVSASTTNQANSILLASLFESAVQRQQRLRPFHPCLIHLFLVGGAVGTVAVAPPVVAVVGCVPEIGIHELDVILRVVEPGGVSIGLIKADQRLRCPYAPTRIDAGIAAVELVDLVGRIPEN